MIRKLLPLPTTASAERRLGFTQLTLSKRSIKLMIACTLVLVILMFHSLSSWSFRSVPYRIDMEALHRILENGTASDIDRPNKHNKEGLTVLGLEADESFHLGTTTLSEYRTQLEEFVAEAFPAQYRKEALASIHLHLDDAPSASDTSFTPIPYKCVLSIKVARGFLVTFRRN
jgi:hypothetical protein